MRVGQCSLNSGCSVRKEDQPRSSEKIAAGINSFAGAVVGMGGAHWNDLPVDVLGRIYLSLQQPQRTRFDLISKACHHAWGSIPAFNKGELCSLASGNWRHKTGSEVLNLISGPRFSPWLANCREFGVYVPHWNDGDFSRLWRTLGRCCQRLDSISLYSSSAPTSGATPRAFDHIDELPPTKKIWIWSQKNFVDAASMSQVAKIKGLTVFRMRPNASQGNSKLGAIGLEGLRALSKAEALTYLELRCESMHAGALLIIAQMSRLEFVYISQWHGVDRHVALAHLGRHPSLRHLSIPTNLNGEGVEQLTKNTSDGRWVKMLSGEIVPF